MVEGTKQELRRIWPYPELVVLSYSSGTSGTPKPMGCVSPATGVTGPVYAGRSRKGYPYITTGVAIVSG